MVDPDLQERYFELLAQREVAGELPAGLGSLPLRSLAELMADIADDATQTFTAEARGTQLIVMILVERLGGDVEISHADIAAVMDKTFAQSGTDTSTVRLTVS